jgi:hypothetical protein
MSSQPQADGGGRPADADEGYFAKLASARYVLVTTFKPDGADAGRRASLRRRPQDGQ